MEVKMMNSTANPSTIKVSVIDQSERLMVETKEEKDEGPRNDVDINGDKLLCSELCSMDETEKGRVDQMRDLLKTQSSDISDHLEEVDDFALRRFLRARDQDVDKALKMLLKQQKWRRSFVPNGSISETEISNEIGQNKFFMQGHDKKGRPVAVLLAARHKQAHLDEFKRYVVYCLDKVCARMPDGHEKFVAIGDLRGWGYANSDIRGYLAALSLLQDCYPERVEKVFIIHAPYIFMAVWRIVYPLIDDKTRKKYIFVENENLKSTLLSEIDESQLPVEYGGKLPLVPISVCSLSYI